jgi:hypothetical protein
MTALLTVLPLAIVMSAGPQFVTAVFLATSRDARRNSLAFLTSAAVATTIGVTVFYFLRPSALPGDADGRDQHGDVGAYLAREGEPWFHSLGFVALTVLIASLPFIAVLLLGRRAETLLPKVRTWMSENSWVVNEAVILFFLVMSLTG